MKFSEVIPFLDDEKEVKAIVKKLISSPRNKDIEMLRDYYDGVQWEQLDQTRFTRRGIEMWKPFGSNAKTKGFTPGELKVWNLEKPAIDTYARYSRGDDSEEVRVTVKRNSVVDEKLSQEASSIFGDLSEWVMEATKRMSVDSVLVTKYDKQDPDVMRIMGDSDAGTVAAGLVKIVDALQIEPLYWYGRKRGYICFYPTKKDSLVRLDESYGEKLKDIGSGKERLYWEVWYLNDDGLVEVVKFFDFVMIDRGLSKEYSSLPFRLQSNGEDGATSFDWENIDNSDVNDLLDLQEHLNKHLTTISQIHDKVAFPMLTLDKDWYKEATDEDFNKLKQNLENLNTTAGSVLVGPFTKLPGEGIPASQDRHIQDIMEQFQMITGIPKSVFNSEGLRDVSGVAVENLFESLHKRVGEKRTKITNSITSNVILHFQEQGLDLEASDIEVNYPPVVSSPVSESMNLLTIASSAKTLPAKYITKKQLELLGDEEQLVTVYQQIEEEEKELEDRIAQKVDEKMSMAQAQKSITDSSQQESELNNLDARLKSLNG